MQRFASGWNVKLVLGLAFGVSTGFAALVNRTIDDETGDASTGLKVVYSPASHWNQGAGCDFCAAKPNVSLAGGGTWHDGSWDPARDEDPLSFSFQFTGVAFYVFSILSRGALTDANVTLDGLVLARVIMEGPDDDGFQYNVPLFGKDGIPWGNHTVQVSSSGPDQSLMLFDYAIYTTDTNGPPSAGSSTSIASVPPTTIVSGHIPPSISAIIGIPPSGTSTPTSSSSSATTTTTTAPGADGATSGVTHHSNTGAIAGGVVGGVVLLLLVLLGGFWFVRRRRQVAASSEKAETSPTPFVANRGRHSDDDFFSDPVASGRFNEKPSLSPHSPLTPLRADILAGVPSSASSAPLSYTEPSESENPPTQLPSASAGETLVSPSRGLQSTSAGRNPSLPTPSEVPSSPPPIPSSPPINVSPPDDPHPSEPSPQARTGSHPRSSPNSSSSRLPSSSTSQVMNELASLRAEVENLRRQQELSMEPLPGYSPPANGQTFPGP